MKKERLDVLLVNRGLSESREKAKRTIMAGIVYVDGQKEDKAGTTFDPDRVPEELSVWDKCTLGSNYIRVAQTIHVEEAVDRYHGPVLVVQGTSDFPDLMKSAADAAHRYEHGELVMIEGATHCYDDHLDQLTETVRRWMAPRIK